MRILFVSHGSSLYGAERSLGGIVGGAVRAGHDVTVVIPEPGPLQTLLRESGVSADHILIHSNARWTLPPRSAGRSRALARVLVHTRRFLALPALRRADVVVVNSAVAPAALFAAALARIPRVVFVRESLDAPTEFDWLLPPRTLGWVLRSAATVMVANSRFIAHQWGTSKVAYPPVARARPAAPAPSVPPGESAPSRSDDGVMECVCLGRLSRGKGQDMGVRAVLAARACGAAVRLTLIGDDTIEPEFAAQLRGLASSDPEAVRFLPFTPSGADALLGYDLFLMTGRRGEPFGRVTVEALQRGLPVLGVRNGDGTEEILRFGGGVLVSPQPQAIADELVALATDPQRLRRLRDSAIGAAPQWDADQAIGTALGYIESAVPIDASSPPPPATPPTTAPTTPPGQALP